MTNSGSGSAARALSLGPVDQILDARRARPHAGRWVGLAGTALLHGGLLLAVLVVPGFFSEPPVKPRFIEVTVLPAAVRGTRARTPPKPEPKPQEPAIVPVAQPEPPKPEVVVPEPTKPDVVKPTPKPVEPKPAVQKEPMKPVATPVKPPEPSPQPISKAPDERAGTPQGSATGTSKLSTRVSVLDDPTFAYDYYLEQMLARIDSAWVRPSVGQAETLVTFRILRDGRVEELAIAESSGNRSFDLAALRAVQNASPLPPLPSSYRMPFLGVNLIVR